MGVIQMHIQVEIKNVYGKELIYPICASAKIFADIADTKTLTFETIQLIKRLGYTIEINLLRKEL